MTGVELLVDGAAAYRLTRLVTKDEITQRIRDRVILRSYLRAGTDAQIIAEDVPGSGTVQGMVESDLEQGSASTDNRLVPRLAAGIVCRWCAGVWIAAGVALARWTVPDQWDPVAYGLTAAAAAALLAGLES